MNSTRYTDKNAPDIYNIGHMEGRKRVPVNVDGGKVELPSTRVGGRSLYFQRRNDMYHPRELSPVKGVLQDEAAAREQIRADIASIKREQTSRVRAQQARLQMDSNATMEGPAIDYQE